MAITSFGDVWDILRDVKAEFTRDRVMSIAAGVTFYVILAIVPAITALIAIFGLIASPEDVPAMLDRITTLLPDEAATLLTDQATRIAAKTNSSLSLTALFALLIALWSANGGMKALIQALGITYDVPEQRGFVRLTIVSLGFTLGFLVLVIVLGSAVAALPFLAESFGSTAEIVLLIGRWPLLFALLLIVLAAVYRWGPNRSDAAWVWISPGAVVAAIGLVLVSAGLGWYVTNFGSYDETYGSLAAVVILMLWIWLSTVSVLVGAEINAELDRRSGARSKSPHSLAS